MKDVVFQYKCRQCGKVYDSIWRLGAEHARLALVDALSASPSPNKAVRAEPVSARYEKGEVHHVDYYQKLEAELCMWEPSHKVSPNRMDAMVWCLTELFGVGEFRIA